MRALASTRLVPVADTRCRPCRGLCAGVAYTPALTHTHVGRGGSLVVEKKVYRMSVLDDDGKLVGVLSRGDIMRVALKMLKSLKA